MSDSDSDSDSDSSRSSSTSGSESDAESSAASSEASSSEASSKSGSSSSGSESSRSSDGSDSDGSDSDESGSDVSSSTRPQTKETASEELPPQPVAVAEPESQEPAEVPEGPIVDSEGRVIVTSARLQRFTKSRIHSWYDRMPPVKPMTAAQDYYLYQQRRKRLIGSSKKPTVQNFVERNVDKPMQNKAVRAAQAAAPPPTRRISRKRLKALTKRLTKAPEPKAPGIEYLPRDIRPEREISQSVSRLYPSGSALDLIRKKNLYLDIDFTT